MNKIILSLILAGTLLSGVNTVDQFDDEGNYKRADEMQASWCEFNEGRDIITNQCDNF